jgi:hypothetical protein
VPSFGSFEQVFSEENILRKDYQLEKRIAYGGHVCR